MEKGESLNRLRACVFAVSFWFCFSVCTLLFFVPSASSTYSNSMRPSITTYGQSLVRYVFT